MDDLEMTKLCAEAMELTVICAPTQVNYRTVSTGDIEAYERYDPLHDDAQCMALMKRFRLHSAWNEQHERWLMSPRNVGVNFGILDMRIGVGENVNSAIVECVAKMQKASKQ